MILHEHIAEHDITPQMWCTLQSFATRRRRLSREGLTHDLERSRKVEGEVYALLSRLEADGPFRGEAELDFTAEGAALDRSLWEHVSGPTAVLLSRFDLHDVETTDRTKRSRPGQPEHDRSLCPVWAEI